MDNDKIRAGSIILKNLHLFNQASVFFDNTMDDVITEAVDQRVGAWLKQQSWLGETDVTETFEGLWVCPAQWREDDDKPFARFNLARQDGDASDSYQLADLCGVGETTFGFRFSAEHSWFGGKKGWNSLVKGLQPQIDAIVNTGWLNEGRGVFFRSLQLSVEALASAWESEDWAEAFAPIIAELDFIANNQKVFDNLLFAARPR